MTQTEQHKKSWLKLIWYIITYIAGIFKQKHAESQVNFENANQNVQNEFNAIDVDTQSENDKINNSNLQDVADKLNNKF